MSSSSKAVCTACYGISRPTTFGSPFVPTPAPPAGNWSGIVPVGRRCKPVAPSDLCRCLSLGTSSDRPAQATPGRPQTGRTLIPAESCEVLITDRFPAYISWERFACIQQRLADNRSIAAALGAPREVPHCSAGYWSVAGVAGAYWPPIVARRTVCATPVCRPP